MPIFVYKAQTKNGKLQEGKIEANNEATATSILQGGGLVVIDLKAEQSIAFYQKNIALFNNVKAKDLAVFSRQLSSLISAGVPLSTAIDMLKDQNSSKVLQEALSDVASTINSGSTLSAALEEYPNIFSTFYVQLVKAGEVSGNLNQTMLFLADHTERAYKTYSKIKSALSYPVFVIIVFIAIFFGVFLFVIPSFVSVLTENDTEIPPITKVMITLSDLTKGYWFVPLIFMAIFIRLFFTPTGKQAWERFQLKIPLIGKIFLYSNIFKFSESFFILLRGGVPIIESLGISEKVVGNHIYREILAEVRDSVAKGRQVGTELAKHPEMPPLVANMVSIGEQTGKLDTMVEHIADFYEDELTGLISSLTTMIQPVIIVFLGGGVFIFILGVMLPIFSTLDTAGG